MNINKELLLLYFLYNFFHIFNKMASIYLYAHKNESKSKWLWGNN